MVSTAAAAAAADSTALLLAVVPIFSNDACEALPFPLDGPLSTPWSENVTTFAEALNSTIASNCSRPLPSVMRAVDRCWCDFSGGFFEPFNVTHWEAASVQRLIDHLERQQKTAEAALKEKSSEDAATPSHDNSMPRTPAPGPSSTSRPSMPTSISSRDLRSILHLFQYALKGDGTPKPSPSPTPYTSTPRIFDAVTATPSPPACSDRKCTLIRKEYDLRPYGLGILVDFGWTQ
ncbi:hypothetical protein DXG03_004506 [Asterophora parasitica]|uniref:Uncharacterized protein n=1 Tax=Asterophora parasitica TaxID=117018 RepID=A0A9P7GCA4_9AGAR|nr:hypothetical protein DXG03_004506 [Asterophora parasitica]